MEAETIITESLDDTKGLEDKEKRVEVLILDAAGEASEAERGGGQ